MTTQNSNQRFRPSIERRRPPLGLGLLLLCTSTSIASAQRGGFDSPGSPASGEFGQTTRLDNEFNPAISLVLDLMGNYTTTTAEDSSDAVDLEARRVDLLIAGWIDPSAMLWTTIAYEEDEFELDEAALEYIELPGNQTFRAGRFFLDFGKQMQAHVEQLRTFDRPLVLREYLGEELAGDGVQWDNWTSIGDTTLMRYSIGGFSNLSGGGELGGHQGDEDDGLQIGDRPQGQDLGFAARWTVMTDVGDSGTLQLGSSVRISSDFAVQDEMANLSSSGLRNTAYGLDFTYGSVADDGLHSWSTGLEALVFAGDLGAEVNDGGTPGDLTDDSIEVTHDSVFGGYAFIERAWSASESAGVQYSFAQEPAPGAPHVEEFDVHYTQQFSEFLRFRIGATYLHAASDEDSMRFGIQLTGTLGPHGHGLNW